MLDDNLLNTVKYNRRSVIHQTGSLKITKINYIKDIYVTQSILRQSD